MSFSLESQRKSGTRKVFSIRDILNLFGNVVDDEVAIGTDVYKISSFQEEGSTATKIPTNEAGQAGTNQTVDGGGYTFQLQEGDTFTFRAFYANQIGGGGVAEGVVYCPANAAVNGLNNAYLTLMSKTADGTVLTTFDVELDAAQRQLRFRMGSNTAGRLPAGTGLSGTITIDGAYYRPVTTNSPNTPEGNTGMA